MQGAGRRDANEGDGSMGISAPFTQERQEAQQRRKQHRKFSARSRSFLSERGISSWPRSSPAVLFPTEPARASFDISSGFCFKKGIKFV